MEINTNQLNLTTLYDERVGRIKKRFLNNDKQFVIFYYMFPKADPKVRVFFVCSIYRKNEEIFFFKEDNRDMIM